MSHQKVLAILSPVLALLGACTAPASDAIMTTASVAPPAPTRIDRGTKVGADNPTRVFVVAGLDANCRATQQPTIVITQPPAKGVVSLQAVPPTMMQFSLSGKCIGQRVPGVGVYYQARTGEAGGDAFTFAVKMGRGDAVSKTIPVMIEN
jgi:hypothetical protein